MTRRSAPGFPSAYMIHRRWAARSLAMTLALSMMRVARKIAEKARIQLRTASTLPTATWSVPSGRYKPMQRLATQWQTAESSPGQRARSALHSCAKKRGIPPSLDTRGSRKREIGSGKVMKSYRSQFGRQCRHEQRQRTQELEELERPAHRDKRYVKNVELVLKCLQTPPQTTGASGVTRN
jgi:hypothetical protein